MEKLLFPIIFMYITILPHHLLIATVSLKFSDSPGKSNHFIFLVAKEILSAPLPHCTLMVVEANPKYHQTLEDNSKSLSHEFNSVYRLRNSSVSRLQLSPAFFKLHGPCSVVLYAIFEELPNYDFFPKNWPYQVPGSYSNSFHLVFHHFHPKKFFNNQLQIIGPLQRIVHKVFISTTKLKNGYKCVLWSCNIFGKEIEIQSPIESAESFWRGQKLNLKQSPLIWGTVQRGHPLIDQNALNDFIKFRRPLSIFITPFVEVSEYLNATPVLRIVHSHNYGTYNEASGKWDGAVAEVIYGRAHITQGIITKQRSEVLFLSKTVGSDGLTFFTGIPQPSAPSALFLINSYNWTVWSALLTTIAALGLISKLVQLKYFAENQSMKCSKVLVAIMSQLIEQPVDSVMYRRFVEVSESRWIFTAWLLSLVVLGATYKTSLISTLTSPAMDYPPKDFRSLLSSDYKINFHGMNLTAGAVFKEMRKKGNPLVRKLEQRIVDYYDDDNGGECVTKAYGHRVACMGIKNVLLDFAIQRLTTETGEKLYNIGRDYLYTASYSFSISKNLPHLIADIDRMMYHYAESGSKVYHLFREKVVQTAEKYGKLAARRRRKEGASFFQQAEQRTKFDTALKTFVVLGVGFGLAGAAFLVEVLY